jgi:protoporphyrinogen oxidase
MQKKPKNEKIAILGAGLSGLTIGQLLSQRNVNFEIFEQNSHCGGLMKSKRANGFCFDTCGSHIIFSKNNETIRFFLSLLKKNVVRKKRVTKILYKGRYVKYPFENGLNDLPKNENFECLNTFIKNLIDQGKNNKSPINLKDWFYCTFGQGISEKYLIPYNEKIWKFPINKIGLDWVQRIPSPPFEEIVKSSLGIKTDGYTHQLFFYYPIDGGIQAITDKLEKELRESPTLNFRISKIHEENGKWIISDGKTERIFNRVISTIPLQKLVKALDAPTEIKNLVTKLKYNSLINVMIGINRNKINNFSWMYIPAKNILPHRVSFPSNYSPKVTPLNKSSVVAEITCNLNDNIWKIDNDKLIERTINDLSDLNVIHKNEVCYADLERTEYAYVINDSAYTDNLKILREYFKQKDIGLVGRFAEFKYLNMDACVESASAYINKHFQ